ncbi:MAG: glucose 1-dehydrogenase [Burkholderiaceae bacterium]
MKLRDRHVFITGAGTGNGAAMARLMAAEGARVAVADIDEASANEVAEAIRAAGGQAIALVQDAAEEAAWDDAIECAIGAFGALRGLVNNAGIARIGDIEHETLAGWRTVQRINLDGVFLGTRAAVRAMRAGEGGSIVNVSSIYGLVGGPRAVAYNASKGGVCLLSKSAALYCQEAGYRIRVNSLHPGYVRTPMIEGLKATLGEQNYKQMQATIRASTPMGRLAEADEIAKAALFLISDDSSYMTGSELVVDGGFTAR